MTNIAMEAMAHLVRWFTVFKSGRSFHGGLLNNQMVKKNVQHCHKMGKQAHGDYTTKNGEIGI